MHIHLQPVHRARRGPCLAARGMRRHQLAALQALHGPRARASHVALCPKTEVGWGSAQGSPEPLVANRGTPLGGVGPGQGLGQ